MKLTLKYFASLREALGPGGALDWTPSGTPTAGERRAVISARWSPGSSTARTSAAASMTSRRR